MHCCAKLMGNWLNSVIYARSMLLLSTNDTYIDSLDWLNLILSDGFGVFSLDRLF